MVPYKFFIRIRSVRWSGALFILVLFYQISTEASNRTFISNSEVIQFAADSTQFSTGKPSRRAKAAQRRVLVTTTDDGLVRDTSRLTLEAIRALPRDSSARLAQFQYVRKDKPADDGTYHKNYALFLPDPILIKHRAVLDSNRWVYRLRRTISEKDTRISTESPMEEYSALRLKQAVRQNWESIVQIYQLQGDAKTTLGDVFSKITKIEIPVPKNPIFSIFGKNSISMAINGAIDIHGGFLNKKSDLYVSSALGESQSTPDFKQEIQVNVKGEIGDKLKISADWNTQRTFEYENQLHVKYQGYDDELVQSVEAGNVSLPTNSSFIGGGSALFGIMAKFQMGPLNLTTVMTQKKGQVKELAISGGGQANAAEIRPSDYSRCHYFIDTSYINFYETMYQVPVNPTPEMERMQIREIEVWISTKEENDPAKFRNVIALMDLAKLDSVTNNKLLRLPNALSSVPGQVEEAKFIKLDQSDYECNVSTGIISLRSQPQGDQAVAVYYMIDNNGSVKTFGQSNQTPKDSLNGQSLNLVLKLVRPKQLEPTMQPAWKMMLKNRYSLGGPGIDKSSFEFRIEYEVSGQSPLTDVTPQNVGVMEMLGLDRFSADNSIKPDKMFDYIPGVTINEARGEIIFPTVEPFDSTSMYNYFIQHGKLYGDIDDAKAREYAGTFYYRTIYTKDLSDAIIDPRNKYYLRGSLKSAQKSNYSLGFNIVEGSVQVIVDGQAAILGTDYTVDYISSQVVIKNQAFLSPGRNIQIKYEANDMFQLASKSLLGARGEFKLGKNSSFGFTIMNYSEQSLSDKVRLGEEPISNMIMGIDGGTTLDANWLTNALNYLPGVKTIAPSQISVRGEFAYMMPNPNTRTSPIANDGGKGVAYVDDFEGARQTIPLGVSYAGWKDASPPWYIKNLDTSYIPQRDINNGPEYIPASEDLYSAGLIADEAKMNYKGHASWFNVIPSDVLIDTLWAGRRKDYAQGEGQVISLDFFFHPEKRGQFNYSMNLQQTIGLDNLDPISHLKSWAGIQHVLGTSSTNLIEQNVAFIEMWIKIVSPVMNNASAKLSIDLGYISEDIVSMKKPNTEDGLDNPSHTRRGIMNKDYDWGLDEMNNATEHESYRSFWQHYPGHSEFESDPSGDDWSRLPTNGGMLNMAMAENYDGVNGTEGNFASEDGHFPDTEDLNRNGTTDRKNSYFEYEIPLNPTDTTFKKLVTGIGGDEWYQIRIPLAEYNRRIGQPTFTNVEGVRLWVTNAGKPLLFRIVDLNLVGNQWEKRIKTDSSYEVSVVNVEDDPLYTPPDNYLRTKDRTRPDQNIISNEQSLNLIVKDLKDGDYKEAVRYMKQRPIDMFNYRTLKMFVHGETGENTIKGYREFVFKDTSNYDAEMFLRFGDDTSNCYEYRAPLRPGWAGNDIVIKFSELTSLKASSDTVKLVSDGNPGAKYSRRGNPRLDRVQFISIGIENPANKSVSIPSVLNGELWVDELRLTDVDDTRGWAYKVDASIKLADIGIIAFSLSQRDPFFHGLEERFGTRNTSRAWSLSTSFALEKFLPETWNGSVLNFSYSHSESINKPRYIPGTDVLVEDAAARIAEKPTEKYPTPDDVRTKAEELSVTDSYSIPTIKVNIPAQTWLVTETINKMTFGYNYTQSHQRNSATEYADAWSWYASFRYGTQFNPNNYLSLGDLKLFFTPQSINFGATLNRSQSKSKLRTQTNPNDIQRNLSAQRFMDFTWQFFKGGLFDLGVLYNVNISSSLIHLETDRYGQRTFMAILSDIFFSDRLINFGIDQNYNQGFVLNTKITAPRVLMMDKIFTPNLRYSVNYIWANNIQAGPIGKSAGWSGGPVFSLDVNLRPITEAIWSPIQARPPAPTPADSNAKEQSVSLSKRFDQVSRILFKNSLFDFEKFSFNLTQSNASQNSGIRGSTGFANIFARAPFFQSSLDENGPTLLYQLGLTADPNGRMILKTKGSFPFLTVDMIPGIRADTAKITDSYSQNNQIAIRTSRPLWDGATLQLDWKVGWTYNDNRNSTTDSTGHIVPKSVISSISGDMSRSYISLPFNLFKTNLDNVNEKFQALKNEPGGTDAEKLSQAFEQGLEAFPWLSKILGTLAPRVNWSIRWDGLENFSILKSFASRISLEHAYNSDYRRRWQLTPTTNPDSTIETTTSQTVTYGFSPLIGVNITFKELIKGSLSATFRYGTKTSYDLSPSTQEVSESSTSDISFTGTYSRQGFEIPFFGLSLMNNIDISFTYSSTHDARSLYNFKNSQLAVTPMDGLSRTTMEPRIRYSASERVTVSFYYRYTRIAPDNGGSKIPGSTTNEGGLDVHVLIQ